MVRPGLGAGEAVLGLDVGGTKCAAVVGDGEGVVWERIEWRSETGRGPDAMIAEMIARGSELIGRHPAVSAVGVSIGGPLDSEQGIVLGPPNLPGWDCIRLKARLEEALRLPVRVMHDAAACALAEWCFGEGRRLPATATLVYLTCGTGFGAGLIIQGRVFSGAGGQSPEFGHVQLEDVDRGGPAAFGRPGTAEALCSGPGLGRIAAWRFPARWSGGPPSPRRIVELAAEGDAQAAEVIACHGHYTGRAGAILIDLLRPDALVLGSLARYLPPAWMAAVRETIAERALPAAAERCRITGSALGDRLQDLSAVVAGFSASAS